MKTKKKRLFKVVSVIIMFVVCIASLSQITFALVYAPSNFDGSDTTLSGPVKDIMGMGLRIVQIVAAGVALSVLVILGIKFITSAPEGRAASKKAFIYYILGFMIVILGEKIIRWIADLI